MKTVGDIMQKDVVSVKHGTKVADAFAKMLEGHFHHIPVLDDKSRVVGILSDRDIRNEMLLFSKNPTSSAEIIFGESKIVDRVMTLKPKIAPPSMTIKDAVLLFKKENISCLPITDQDKLLGIVTETDLLDYLLFLLEA